jgi:hypothetical protein
VTPLGPGEMRARHRPLVVLGIAAVRLLGGFALALPLASVVGEGGVGQTLQGDRVLFEGGGYLLLEVLRIQGADLAAVARGMLPLLSLGLLLTVVCNAALLVALNVRGRLELGTWLSRALARLPAFLVLGCAVCLAQLVLWFAGAMAADSIPEPQHLPRATSAAQLASLLLAGAMAGALGGFADVVKASLVRHDAPLTSGLSQAWHCLRRRPWACSMGWLPFAVAYVVALLLAAGLTEALDVSRSGAWRLLAVLTVHQLVIAWGVLLRAAWFARTLRLSASLHAEALAPALLPKLAQIPR